MKKAFKIFVPILLAAAIILGVAWYLFIYDRDFTRDMLLQAARHFDSQGQHAIGAWCYDQAYVLADDNDAVAIELAEQHIADGNYTQAEAILSRAIEDGGGINLYTALCKTYIAQDKIMDAVKLLNGITNPELKSQLDSIRPAAPKVTPDPGFYNQYISVTITAESGTLYVNPLGEYPSILDAPYAEPVLLSGGENTIYAVALADNGLVSPLSVFGYTVGGVIEEIQFVDKAFEESIRHMLGVSSDTTLFSNDLWEITYFEMPAEAESYADLKYMPFLEELVIQNGVANQLQYVSGLSHLNTLKVINTPVTSEETAIISSLSKLEKLTLSDCGLSSVAGLEKLVDLTYLDLSDNTIRNISSLSALKKLSEVYLQRNVLTELSSLSGLTSVKILDISYNAISDLGPISNMSVLSRLNASNNQLSGITSLSSLTGLTHLDISCNNITSIRELAVLNKLTELNLSTNAVSDISCLAELSSLQNLDFSHNQVSELPAFADDSQLVSINGSHNLLEDLKALSGLQSLNNVTMDYNENIEAVDCLANCPRLVIVNVFGTKVKEVEMLTGQSIVVNFDPTQE